MTDLELQSVTLGKRIREVNLRVRSGGCLVVVGPNGAGKSSLLRLLSGLETPDRGQVLLDGSPLSARSPVERAGALAWLPQRPSFVEPLAVEEVVAAGRYRFGESHGESVAHARQALCAVNAEELIGRRSDRISGGELQRVLLATLLAQEAPLLLVDEPANHLDPAHQLQTYRLLGKLWARGLGVLVVTHDINLAGLLGPRERIAVVGLREGRIALSTTLSDPELPQRLGELYSVPFVSVRIGAHEHLLVDHEASE